MMKKRLTASRGFTLIELIIATAIMIFVVLAIGMALVDGQRGWNYMYNRVYSDIVTDGFVARRKLDAVLRNLDFPGGLGTHEIGGFRLREGVTVHGILPVVSRTRRVVDPEFLAVGRRFCR